MEEAVICNRDFIVSDYTNDDFNFKVNELATTIYLEHGMVEKPVEQGLFINDKMSKLSGCQRK